MLQQSFNFISSPSYLAQDFISTPSNQLAFDKISNWPNNRSNNLYPFFLLIYGQKGCGKTHLANIWRQKTSASIILSHQSLVAQDTASHIVIEDINNDNWSQQDLLHMFNFCHEAKIYCLFTSSIFPAQFALKDLESRINSIDAVKITPPDLDTIKILLRMEFSKKSLEVQQKNIDFLAQILPRNFDCAINAVSTLNDESLKTMQPISYSMIKKIFL